MEVTKKKLYDVKLRELESLLREKGNDLIVVDYSTESLLPPGENYGSTILKVDVVVKKSPHDEEEKLHLVAKMLPATEFQRDIFDTPYTVKKEIFLYEELLPTYRSLEREFGFKDDELFDVAPRLYGARCTLKPDSSEVDDDAVILMQNLKVLGYYCMDKKKGSYLISNHFITKKINCYDFSGFDLIHAKVAVAALARFHGLGIATKQHKPELFENIKNRAKSLKFSESFDIRVPQNYFLKIFREDPVMCRHYDIMKVALTEDQNNMYFGTPPEPWATIVHSDFWVNNIMFRNKEEVKFVDFQNFLFLSPMRELVFCLMVNLEDEVMKHDFDYLLDYYYKKLIETLKRMKCDTSQFGRDSFEERLKIDAYQEFSHIPILLKVMTTAVEEGDEHVAEHMFMETGVNALLEQKLCRVVLKYAEKGWFNNKDICKSNGVEIFCKFDDL